uniref:Uncharacterized protein n=2 Tax=Stomoxys calcitrans TaxID=35570 RepID=A0A1I8PWC1_STOCA
MRVSLPGDLLIQSAFDPSMVLQNHNTIQTRSVTLTSSNRTTGTTASTSSTSSADDSLSSPATTTYGMKQQRPIIDLLVAMIAVPILILCALQLEKNLHDMGSSPESRWLVFALGIGMLIVSVIICGYVTHRMGVCIWAGPIDETGNRVGSSSGSRGVTHINSQNDILRIVDSLPPSYDSVVKFDIPPPPYDCLVIDMEQSKDEQDSPDKANTSSAETSVVHM